MDSQNPLSVQKPEPHTQAKAPEQGKATTDEITKTVTFPESDSQKPYRHCQITCKQERDWLDHLKTAAEVAGLILLAVYTGYTIKMYRANKQAADAAASAADTANKTLIASKHSSWLDQRPWITPIVGETPEFKVNESTNLIMKLENTGKSPAEKIGGHVSFLAYEKGYEDDLIHPRRELSGKINGGFLNPGSHITTKIPAAVYRQSGQIVVNTAPVLEYMNKGDIYLMIHGKITYVDAWKVDHWIQFCAVVIGNASDQHPACTEYNQIDHNEPN